MDLGRTSLASVSKEWLLEVAAWWLILAAWAVAYGALFSRVRGASVLAGLRRAGFAHSPLLLCFILITAVYASDTTNHAFTAGPYRAVFQTAARSYVFLAPALVQVLLLALSSKRSLASALPLGLICTLAIALRVWNIDWSLPALFHPDEHHYIGVALTMLGANDLNPHYFQNPSLLIYLDYLLIRVLSPHVQEFHGATQLFGAQLLDPRGDLLVDLAARSVSVCAGTLTVVAVYYACKELFDRWSASAAALLLAVSFLHVRDSHYATNDVLGTFLLASSFLCACRIATRGHTGYYIAAGLIGGLAASTKYNMGIFVVGVMVAHLIRLRGNRSPITSPSEHGSLLMAGSCSAVGFVAGTPYSVLDFSSFMGGFRSQYDFGAMAWTGQSTGPSLFMYAIVLVQGFGMLQLLSSALGSVAMAKKCPSRLMLVASIPIAYLSFMFTQQLFFARFAIPVLPFLAIMAGYGVIACARALPCPQKAVLAVLMVAIVGAPQLAASWQSDSLLDRADTRALAAAWIDRNLPGDATVAVESSSQMDGRYGWPSGVIRPTWVFRPTSEDSMRELLSGQYQYVVVSSFAYGIWSQTEPPGPDLPGPYQSLTDRASLMAVFSPGAGREVPYNLEDMYTPFWNLDSRERSGPVVRVYQIANPVN